MTQYWEPGTQYNDGDVVEYEGHKYKIIQPHRSQSDWTPPVTPALWGKLQDGDDRDDQHHDHQQHHGQQQQHQQQQHGHGHEKGNHGEGERDDEIFGIDKDKFTIGAGVLGGAAVLGGGAALYKHHKDKKEEGRGAHEEEKKDEEIFGIDKDKFMIGAGILGGAAILGGGAAIYKHHKDNEERERED